MDINGYFNWLFENVRNVWTVTDNGDSRLFVGEHCVGGKFEGELYLECTEVCKYLFTMFEGSNNV